MPKPKKVWPPLTEEQLQFCPFGVNRCKLCRAEPHVHEDMNNKKLKENMPYGKLRLYLRETYSIKADFKDLCDHFNIHVKGIDKTKLVKVTKGISQETARELQNISGEVRVSTSEDLEKAYRTLVNMAADYTKSVRRLQDLINLEFDRRSQDELKDEVKNINMLDLLDKLGKINKENREFVKEISMLRAPKVMVANFLESFINSLIKDFSALVANMAGELKNAIQEELSDAGHPNLIGDQVYANVFKIFAEDYRNRVMNMRRQHLGDAMSALQDLEKLV